MAWKDVEPRAGFGPATPALPSDCEIGHNAGTNARFWLEYRRFLLAEYSHNVALDYYQYGQAYQNCLATNNLTRLKTLSTDKRLHAMKALSALSKFLGVYDVYKQMLKAYGLKWSVNTDNAIIARLVKARTSGDLVDWIKMVKREFPEFATLMDFITATGLRFNEALASHNLIVELARKGKIDDYYNEEQQVLEHYRFRSIFIRRTKKTFMSYVPKTLVQRIMSSNRQITEDMIEKRMARRKMARRFGDIREFYATHATRYLSPPEIDFIQGRTSATVFMRNYFNPLWIKDLTKRTMRNAQKMLKLIESD